MDSTPFQKLVEIARERYNTAESANVTQAQAYEAIVLGLQSLISTNIGSISSVTNPI
jgi:hypothetical protein